MIKQTTYLILAIALTTFGLTSCETDKKPTQQDIVRANAEEYLKPKMNDPASYEFADLKLIDSILYSDNVDYRKKDFQRQIKSNKDLLAVIATYKKEFPKVWEETKKEEADKVKTEIEKNEKILSEIDKLESELGEKVNDVASYTYLFSFRGTNKMGAKVLNEYILQTNSAPDFKVLNLAEDKDKVILNPNQFPGYKEMITKFIY